jgi:tetratricopeptide (TPR) repeat protein
VLENAQKLGQPPRQVAASINLITTPPNITDWVGRSEEVRQLQTWLADASVNLIGIQGLGGLGKSALAAYLYGDSPPPGEESKNHKFWADVSQNPDFTYFAEKIIEGFGGQISQQGNVTLLINDLLKCLNQRRCLLVIDNLETLLNSERQWLDAAYEQFFSRWVQQGKTSILLVTTQEKPVLFQSQRCWYPLTGMKISEGAQLLQQLGIQGSVTELSAFARAVDGHPLTLRLAAGYLREYCGSQLSRAQKLGKQFEQVAAEAEGLHRDKQDAWLSWILQQHFGRLTEIQAGFLCNLSVYRQPFDYQAAAGMLANDGEVAAMDIQRLLSELFNRSLLLKIDDKYQYQLLVRQYVQQKATDLSVAHQKAINYYLLHKKASPWQTRDDVTEYLEIFYHHCELKQYAQAFDTIRERNGNDDCNNFLNLGGYNTIRVQLYSQLVKEWEPNQENQWKIAAALTSLGNAYDSLGDYQQAIDYHQQALVIFQEIGDRSGIAISLNNLANAYQSLGEYQQAIVYDQQSLVIKQEIGARSGIASSLNNLGNAYDSLGEYQQAIDYHQQSLVIAQEIGDRSGIAKSLGNLGIAYNSLGEYQQAIDYYQQSLVIKQEIGARSGIANSFNNLGIAYKSQGEYQQAIDYYQQSLVIAQEIGDRRGEANAWFNLAIVLNKLNREQDAMGADLNARQLYQAMQLDADVQDCDNKIQQIEASLAASHVVVRRFPIGVLGLVRRWLQRLWQLVRGGFRR